MHYETLSTLSLIDPSVELNDFDRVEFALESRAPDLIARAGKLLDECRRQNAEILHPKHPSYPVAFTILEQPPLFLSILGACPWLENPCLSIVGSREPRREAIEWMDLHLSALLRRFPKLTIVSGGARGIDRNAHLNSLRAGLPTVIFLPSGLGIPYPVEIGEFFEPVLKAGGCVISPFAPLQEVRRSCFEARNRLIAAMGTALFVVEGRRKSGSIMTARLAVELGRDVCVLPGFPGDPKCAGTVDLLVNGATLIRDEPDLATFLGKYV